MSDSLAGKIIFITGAASGIGKAAALKLAKLGANLVLTDVVEIEYEVAFPDSSQQSDLSPIITAELDVSNEAQCQLVVKEVVQYYGRIDHVFNCAGINPTAYSILELPDGYFDKLWAVNVKGTYNVTKAALPHMKEHAGCSFVNVSSIMGQRPAARIAAYCATKYAVMGFSKSMALELGPKGIRVNIIAPGFIDTPTNNSVVAGPDAVKESEASVSLGRMGTAEEVADVVAFLMSKEARYMNGSEVSINGGLKY